MTTLRFSLVKWLFIESAENNVDKVFTLLRNALSPRAFPITVLRSGLENCWLCQIATFSIVFLVSSYSDQSAKRHLNSHFVP